MDHTFAVRRAGASARLQMRAVRSADMPFIDAMVARLFPLTGPGDYTLEEACAGTRRVLHAAISEARADALFEIAHDERGECAGFIYAVTVSSFFTAEPHAHISEIVAARDRSGAGRVMMARAEDWSRERGYRRITLNVMHTNAGARAFYERLGYNLEVHRLTKLLG